MAKKKVKSKSPRAKSSGQWPAKLEHPKKVSFHYRKSTLYRVVRVDGIHGGVSPTLDAIAASVFSVRQPIPKSETFPVLKDGKLDNANVEVDKIDGLVREVEVTLIFDITTARSINKWLSEKLAEHDAIRAALSSRQEQEK